MIISMKVNRYAIMKMVIANGARVPTRNTMVRHQMEEKREFGTAGKRTVRQSGVLSPIRRGVPGRSRMNTRLANATVVVKADAPHGRKNAQDVALNLIDFQ